jgi:septal ring-binding cell division protein DamX
VVDPEDRAEAPWPHAATLVLAARTPRQRRWAVASAIDIVRKLAEVRPKVVLADLQTRTPSSLAASLGVGETKGIVDVLFHGAPFSAAARRPEGEFFYFLSLGTELPTRQLLYGHARWKRIAERLAQTDAHLFPCVAAEDWLEAGPIPGFEACIILNAVGHEIELPAGARRIAEFLAPPEVRDQAAVVAALPEYAEPPTQPMAMPVAPPREERPLAQARRPVGPPRRAAAPEPAPGGRGAAAPRPALGPSRRRRRRPLLIPAALTVAAAATFVLWRVWTTYQATAGAPPIEAAADTSAVAGPELPATEPQPSPAAPEAAAPGRLQAVSLPYSVAIASYSSFEDAVTRQRDWTRADVPFYVAPTVVRGVVYYRVFAGMLRDRAQAQALMERLVRDNIKDMVRDWDVRPARLAFNLGAYATEPEARAAVEALRGRGIPAYVLPAVGADGGSAYGVYAGGYENAEDARPLRELIQQAGLTVKLEERVGLEVP